MAIPLLQYPLKTQNARVPSLGAVQSDLTPPTTRSAGAGSGGEDSEINQLIEKAYRQIYFHAMRYDRDPYLESQLRNGTITVRDFIRGLLLSRRFSEGYYNCNSNYRLVDQLVGRVLGRPVHGDEERRAWSIIIGQYGFGGFIDRLLDSEEYISAFGYDQVPQQRSRLLPGRTIGEIPIYQQFPRYGADWRDIQQMRAPSDNASYGMPAKNPLWKDGEQPAWVEKVWYAIIIIGSVEISRILLTVVVAMLSVH